MLEDTAAFRRPALSQATQLTPTEEGPVVDTYVAWEIPEKPSLISTKQLYPGTCITDIPRADANE